MSRWIKMTNKIRDGDLAMVKNLLSRKNQFIYLEAVVRPRTELHETRLLIEGKVSDVNLAGGFENCRWCPKNLAGIM